MLYYTVWGTPYLKTEGGKKNDEAEQNDRKSKFLHSSINSSANCTWNCCNEPSPQSLWPSIILPLQYKPMKDNNLNTYRPLKFFFLFLLWTQFVYTFYRNHQSTEWIIPAAHQHLNLKSIFIFSNTFHHFDTYKKNSEVEQTGSSGFAFHTIEVANHSNNANYDCQYQHEPR